VFLSVSNPFWVTLLLVDLFSTRYSMTRMMMLAVVSSWRLLLAIVATWLLVDHFYAFLYWDFAQDWVSGGNVCSSTLTCFLFMFDQTYRNDAGFLSTTSDNYDYFGNWKPTFQVLVDYSYIVIIFQIIKVMFGGSIINTFGDMRTTDSRKRS
jgi:hypothetical protein